MQKNYKKDLTLKSNSVKRLLKEYLMYDKELNTNKNKFEELKNTNADASDLKRHEEYVFESSACRDKVKNSLRIHTDELINLINEISDDETRNLDEFKKANDIMNESIQFFEKNN